MPRPTIPNWTALARIEPAEAAVRNWGDRRNEHGADHDAGDEHAELLDGEDAQQDRARAAAGRRSRYGGAPASTPWPLIAARRLSEAHSCARSAGRQRPPQPPRPVDDRLELGRILLGDQKGPGIDVGRRHPVLDLQR